MLPETSKLPVIDELPVILAPLAVTFNLPVFVIPDVDRFPPEILPVTVKLPNVPTLVIFG